MPAQRNLAADIRFRLPLSLNAEIEARCDERSIRPSQAARELLELGVLAQRAIDEAQAAHPEAPGYYLTAAPVEQVRPGDPFAFPNDQPDAPHA